MKSPHLFASTADTSIGTVDSFTAGHDPGDEHHPVFATGMTAEHPATPPVFHAHERMAPLDDVGSRVLLVSHAYRRASADPANATLWLAVAREATGLANALDSSRG